MAARRELEVYEGTGDPVEDLAFEQVMLDRAAAGVPSMSLCSWAGPVVVLGYAQAAGDADLAWCRGRHVPVLRRLTGGTGVIYHGDLAVSLALPARYPWSRGVLGMYHRFLDVLEPALRGAGADVRRVAEPRRASRVRSPICFEDQLSDTLLVGGRKAVGCAQTRRGGAALIHAAILLGLDPELYAAVFGVPADRVRAGLAAAAPGADWRALGESIARSLGAALRLKAVPGRRPAVPDEVLARYDQPRWAPVGGGEEPQESARKGALEP